MTRTASQYEPSPTPSRAFAAIRTPPPTEPISATLRRAEAESLSNGERLRAISARLGGLESRRADGAR